MPKKIFKNESGIINLDSSQNQGSHWTAYIKKGKDILYFDSYGNLRPPIEVISYFYTSDNKNIIRYNYDRHQTYNKTNCGQLCIKFLYNNM